MKRPHYCPTCNQLVVPPLHFPNSKVKQRIYDYVAKHPNCSRTEVMDAVYAHDEDGGPATYNVINVHLAQMRHVLHKAGLRIHSTRGPHAVYRVEKEK